MSLPTYTVKRGDSLSRIARTIYQDPSRWRLLADANYLYEPWYIQPGQQLVLPPPPVQGPRTRSDECLGSLAPPLTQLGTDLVRHCEAAGVVIRVSEGFRSWIRQDALYAQGRTAPGRVVTNAKGGESFHNFGLAFDIELLDRSGRPTWDARNSGWSTAGRLGVALGLRWGGNWKRIKDLPHFELRSPLALEDCRRLYPLGLREIWTRLS